MTHLRRAGAALAALALAAFALAGCARPGVAPDEARSIAKEAYIYGFPLVDNYRIMHAYFVDAADPEYKAPWNELKNMPRVYTPADRSIQTPNSDTPYSMAGLDLRAEPMVITVPPIGKDRYYSVQLIDLYTFNFDYIGSRATGSEGGSYLVAGPGWKGEPPAGVAKVFRCETEQALAAFRTQLLNPADLDNVKAVQAGYKVQPLSAFLGQAAPAAAPALDWPKPLTPEEQKTSLEFFRRLDVVLRSCPVHPSETELRARFAKLGIGGGKGFDPAALSPETKQAMEAGMAEAWKELEEFQKTSLATGKVTSGDMFGTREFLKNDYLHRFAAAVLGIYGNSKQEAMYPVYFVDADGQPLDGAQGRYTLCFAADALPPANAFWSVTMYDQPASLLVANPIDRYLINSPMLPNLKRDADGGLTLHVRHDSPGKARESNWLPAPAGPFMLVLRIYWPKPEALDGSWKQPPLLRTK